MEIKIKEQLLMEAAERSFDSFLATVTDAIKDGIGGELRADNMSAISAAQTTLLAYDTLRSEVMDGGFVQLIHNGYGPFIFLNPFAKVLKMWGLRDLARLIGKGHKLFVKYRDEIERDCDDETFMAMFEHYPEMDDLDDCFVENEEEWTASLATYVDEHLSDFVTVER